MEPILIKNLCINEIIKITYINDQWEIENTEQLENTLPARLSHIVRLPINLEVFELLYDNLAIKNRDYPWIFLLKILEGEFGSFEITNKQVCEKYLSDFSSKLVKQITENEKS